MHMPWSAADASQHTGSADTAEKQRQWASTANSVRKRALASGKDEKEAEFMAIREANGSISGCVHESLREFVTSAGATPTANREDGVIVGCKILGTQSKNPSPRNFLYPESTREAAAGLYEGVVCNVDHHETGSHISYRDRIGAFKNVECRQDGLYGDFHFNPKHALAEQLCWDAENAPHNLGFSHVADGKINRSNPNAPVVEQIKAVESVDLVANPATTRGLFESEEIPEGQQELCVHGLSAISDARAILLSQEPIETKESRLLEVLATWRAELAGGTPKQGVSTMEWTEVTVDGLKEHRNDLVQLLTGTDKQSQLTAEIGELNEAVKAGEASLKEANEKIAALEAEKAAQAKELAIAEELKEAKLDQTNKTIVSEAFLATLKAAPDAEARKSLIEDRVAVTKTLREGRPTGSPPFGSIEGGSVGGPKSKKDLLEKL
jgi:hypothetical protein